MVGAKRFYQGLDSDIKAMLLAQIRNLWTHASSAIEGNSLTLGDTEFVLSEGLTVKGKSLRDHQDIVGHARAIEVVYRLLDKVVLNEGHLFLLHSAIVIDPPTDAYQPVGAWKVESNFTTYRDENDQQQFRQYPSHVNTPALMQQWLENFNGYFNEELSRNEAAQAYAELHLDFVSIHPFCDGNGRMARLVANLPVLRSGFPPIIVPSTERQDYIEAISAYQGTISDLGQVKNLSDFPDNPERKHFISLCNDYWHNTIQLVDKAFDAQGIRDNDSREPR